LAIALEVWLDLMRREYIETYVREGGGAVRFAVADEAVLQQADRRLRETAQRAGFTVVAIDAAAAKIQMLHLVFFAIARAIDWSALAQARLEALAIEAGYTWPVPGRRVRLEELAAANGIAPAMLQRELLRRITQVVWRDPALAQDFRRAMVTLMEALLVDDIDPLRDAVIEWLRGDLRTLRPVRPAGIGARIGLQNARAMLLSLCHWMHLCNGSGLAVILDIRQLLRDRRELVGGAAYTPAAVMAAYEVIRQVIDDAEHYRGLFLAVLADHRLHDDSVPKRGLAAYDALRLRLSNDVRPAAGENPLAPLVVLAA